MSFNSLGSNVIGNETHDGGARFDGPAYDSNDGKVNYNMEPNHEQNTQVDHHGEHPGEHHGEGATHDGAAEPTAIRHDEENHPSEHHEEGHHPSLA